MRRGSYSGAYAGNNGDGSGHVGEVRYDGEETSGGVHVCDVENRELLLYLLWGFISDWKVH